MPNGLDPWRWLVAIPAVMAAFALTMLLVPFVEADVAPIYLAAVMFSAWRGGLGAALMATAMSSLVRAYFFLPPAYSFTLDADGIEELGVFALAAIIISSMSAARDRAMSREREARREAETANAVKDEFIAAVSHELRTPLTTIKALTRVLQRDDTSVDERVEYLADIASECERQIDLVNNLLDLTRIKSGGVPISVQSVDVPEIVRDCEKVVRVEASEYGHSLDVCIEPGIPRILADRSALRRAVCAVIENAIKYTPAGGRIRVGARRAGSTHVAIEVEDNGSGIRPEDLPHIFDRFYRGESPQASMVEAELPGIGLGLHLAKVLAAGMNGTITVESVEGMGSKFTIQIPVDSEAVTAGEQPDAA